MNRLSNWPEFTCEQVTLSYLPPGTTISFENIAAIPTLELNH
jgi:hypothetical protein